MYEIEELEAQWRRFRRKRYLRQGLIALGIFFLLGLPIVYVSYKGEREKKNTIVNIKNDKGIVNSSKKVSAPVTKVKKFALASLPSVKPLQPEVPSMQSQSSNRVLPQKPRVKRPKMTISFVEPSTSKKIPNSIKKSSMRMETVNVADISVIHKLEKRFPLSRDYDDAMYLAKYYYGKRNYRKAEYWAMQANTIDSSQSESWMIFAKAKAKQGHRREALKVLQAYYDRYGNMEVKLLIDRIRKGKKY